MLVVLLPMAASLASAGPITCLQQWAGTGPVYDPPRCVPPDAPPEQFGASYDTASDVLTLTWLAPANAVAPDSYSVYRDGTLLGTTSTLTMDDDLTGFYGSRSYWVSGVWGTHEGDASLPLNVGRTGGLPTSCPVADVTIMTSLPFVAYSVHDECLP